VIAAALVTLALLAGLWWSRRGTAPAPSAPVDPLADLPVEQAYDTAIRLVNEGHSKQSLPYFEHARRGAAELTMRFHYNYGAALFNSLFETEPLAGVERPAWRTSDARVAAMRECLAQKLEAVNAATTPQDRAYYADRLARILQVWGFQWEAYLWYRQAAQLDPSNRHYARRADAFLDILANPLHAPAAVPLDSATAR
jgi:hypothetical protein